MTVGLKDNPLVPIGPGFYPRIVLGITAALAAALLWFSFRDRTSPHADREEKNYSLVFSVFLVFGLYVGALPFLGFRIATLVFVAAMQATLEPPRSTRGCLAIAASALITTFVCYFVFEKYLSVLLPRGRWTDF